MLRVQTIPMALVATVLFVQALPQTAAFARSPRNPENAARVHADEILGYWQRRAGEAVVEIRRSGGGYQGVIVASKRRPEVVGTEIFRSLRFNAETGRWRGRVYSIERRRDFNVEIALPDPDHFVLKVRVAFFSRSVRFNRQPSRLAQN